MRPLPELQRPTQIEIGLPAVSSESCPVTADRHLVMPAGARRRAGIHSQVVERMAPVSAEVRLAMDSRVRGNDGIRGLAVDSRVRGNDGIRGLAVDSRVRGNDELGVTQSRRVCEMHQKLPGT